MTPRALSVATSSMSGAWTPRSATALLRFSSGAYARGRDVAIDLDRFLLLFVSIGWPVSRLMPRLRVSRLMPGLKITWLMPRLNIFWLARASARYIAIDAFMFAGAGTATSS